MAIGWKRRREVPELRLIALDARDDEAREFRILQPEATVGSGEDSRFVIRRASISRRHASVTFRKDRHEISDLGSTNGTFVNGGRVSGPTTIEVGDEVRFGDALFVVGKPADTGIRSTLWKAPRKLLTRRGTLEIAILAFAIGFGTAQYLAYLLYHEQNRLILAEAEPISQPGKALALSAAPSPSVARSTEARKVPARVSVNPQPVETSSAAAIGARELVGGVALARLITGSGNEAGRSAPNFALPDLDGGEVALDTIRGKVVLVNFWATWCSACRSEMPSLENLYRDLRKYPDFAVLTVSIDQGGKPAVAQFMASNGYNFPVLLDSGSATSTAYGVTGIPSTFVIGRDGQIIWNCVGALDWSNPIIRDALKKLL